MGLPSAHPGQHKANRPQAAGYPPALKVMPWRPHSSTGTLGRCCLCYPFRPTQPRSSVHSCRHHSVLKLSFTNTVFFFNVNSTSRVAGVQPIPPSHSKTQSLILWKGLANTINPQAPPPYKAHLKTNRLLLHSSPNPRFSNRNTSAHSPHAAPKRRHPSLQRRSAWCHPVPRQPAGECPLNWRERKRGMNYVLLDLRNGNPSSFTTSSLRHCWLQCQDFCWDQCRDRERTQ